MEVWRKCSLRVYERCRRSSDLCSVRQYWRSLRRGWFASYSCHCRVPWDLPLYFVRRLRIFAIFLSFKKNWVYLVVVLKATTVALLSCGTCVVTYTKNRSWKTVYRLSFMRPKRSFRKWPTLRPICKRQMRRLLVWQVSVMQSLSTIELTSSFLPLVMMTLGEWYRHVTHFFIVSEVLWTT